MASWDPAATPYPSARREEHYDTYRSAATKEEVKVHDPYVWLEKPPSESEETKKFVEEQAALTASFLKKDPNRDRFRDRLTQAYDYARFSCPSLKKDGYYYWSYNSGLQAQALIYRTKKSDLPDTFPDQDTSSGGSLFFDPNRLSSDGTASLSATAFSETGKYYAYGISRSGSDWFSIYVRRTDTPHKELAAEAEIPAEGQDDGRLEDVVRHAKFSGITWTHNDAGFFYQRYPSAIDHKSDTADVAGTETDSNENAMVYYHRLGTSQDEDVLIFKNPDAPDHMFGTEITDDGRYLILGTHKDTSPSSKTWIADLKNIDLKGASKSLDIDWTKVVDEFGARHDYIANDGSRFYFMTNQNAPCYKMVAYDLGKPEQGFTDLIAEDPESILTSAFVVNQDELLVVRSRDVKDELHVHTLQTGEKKGRIAANLIGDFAQFTGRREHSEIFFKMTGFSNPGLVYRYDFKKQSRTDKGSAEGEKLFRSTVVNGLKPEEFETEQIFYSSKDGTKVPMFIVTPSGAPKDGSAPLLLYGYGGFSISMTSFFSVEMLTFIKAYGGRLAVANIRGGAEYGEEWHEAGTKERKQNVFDDFQYAAKYLTQHKYTSPSKLAIYGGSNGGLLTAACANQAPELFGCVLAAVGVLDMLKFHRFTIGKAWCSDYGCADDPTDFDYLIKYSPVHNVKKVDGQTYPPTMLLTGDHDDRVVPLHSFKHAATLQHVLADNSNPLLLRVQLKAGHGAGKSTQQRIEEAVDRFGFAALTMNLDYQE